MLGVNQLDFINYANALKGNYRKGIHKMEAIMASPTHAKEFASNLGGVSVVLSVPIGKEDRNSAQLLDLLLNSDVADDAVYTWMGQFYEFSSWDDLLGDEDRCKAMMANELLWRALSASGVAMGKTVATLAGLSCSAYDDMSAVAASSTAMTAVINNATALNAVVSSSTAMTAVINNSIALNTVVSSSTAMTAIASSQTAMAAVANNKTALTAVINNASALNTVVSSSTAMTAIASSQTAMTAVCSSALAFNAALKNSTARTQLAGSSYLQSNYDKLLSTIGNSTYFSQKFDNIDSGAKRAISGGNTDTTATANESVFLCKKIGAWSNGNSVTGTVAHLQTKTTAGSISTRAGGGQSTDDYTTGGVQAKYICIGGCTFTENGDAYCCGIFAFAK